MIDKELMQQALDALNRVMSHGSAVQKAKDILRESLAQPEQEPVFDCPRCGHCCPQRKPLTSQERDAQRWRFLMENSYDSESATQFHVWKHSWEPHSKTGEPTEWKQRVRGIALIDFIDRAIEAAHGIKGEA